VQQPIDPLGDSKAPCLCALHSPPVEQFERGRGEDLVPPSAAAVSRAPGAPLTTATPRRLDSGSCSQVLS
jgi:hypothetical protein